MSAMCSSRKHAVLSLIFLMLSAAAAQQAPDPAKLALDPATLPPASPKHPYKFQFQAHGGIPPYKYAFTGGVLPPGTTLGADGLLTGTPPARGQFRFTVSVTDSSTPPQSASRLFVLRVVAPLLMEWKKYAHVSGNRVDGSVVVSNGTEDDFDFTFVVLAVVGQRDWAGDSDRLSAFPAEERYRLVRNTVRRHAPQGNVHGARRCCRRSSTQGRHLSDAAPDEGEAAGHGRALSR